jgi:hypothetical protein
METGFRQKVGGERVLLMLPASVVMMGRVRGDIDPSSVVLCGHHALCGGMSLAYLLRDLLELLAGQSPGLMERLVPPPIYETTAPARPRAGAPPLRYGPDQLPEAAC